DVRQLHTAAQQLVERYPNLRAAFTAAADGTPVQVISDAVEVPWQEMDLRWVVDKPGAVQRDLAADKARGFEMDAAPLLRFTLYRTDAAAWQLGITGHHILLDGWSLPLLLRDLLVLYAGAGSALEPVTEYRDYLQWLGTRDEAASLSQWSDSLAGVSDATLLAPQAGAGADGLAKVVAALDVDLSKRLAGVAAELGVTVNTVVQSAWGILLSRLTGRSDVVFGATVSGRPADLPGVESMVGLFINTLPVRVRVDNQAAVADLLSAQQRGQADLLDHHYVGLTEIQRVCGVGAQFDSLVVFESYPIDTEALAAVGDVNGMRVVDVDVDADNTEYPMTLIVTAEPTLSLTLKYRTNRFTEAEAVTLGARLVRVLEAVADDPRALVGDIEILDEAELKQLVDQSTAPAAPPAVSSQSVAAALMLVVEDDPEAPAIYAGEDEVSYDELARRSSRLARALIGKGIGPGDVVALATPRSAESVVATWAVLAAGAAVWHTTPESAADEGVALALRPAELAALAAEAAELPSHPVTYADRTRSLVSTDPALVVSAGDGARSVLTQEQALTGAAQLRTEHGIDYESRTFTRAVAGPLALAEFLAWAMAGAATVIADGDDLAELLAEEEVTHAFLTPAEAAADIPDVTINR
ncbi:MAG: AMP-binding protein, partial [Mycobacteriaceae bacterium]|nr:AMP-binding protein [Mycobacteriaceae bacterium]